MREPLFKNRHHLAVGGRFRHTDKAADSFPGASAVGEQAAAYRASVIFDVVEKQSGTRLTRNLARDRADLFVPIDFDTDTLKISPFVKIVYPVTQVDKCHGRSSFPSLIKSFSVACP